MPKQIYIPFVCGRCDMHFGILKKDYNKKHAYNCPMCLSANVVMPDDLKPDQRRGRPRKRVGPTIFQKDEI